MSLGVLKLQFKNCFSGGLHSDSRHSEIFKSRYRSITWPPMLVISFSITQTQTRFSIWWSFLNRFSSFDYIQNMVFATLAPICIAGVLLFVSTIIRIRTSLRKKKYGFPNKLKAFFSVQEIEELSEYFLHLALIFLLYFPCILFYWVINNLNLDASNLLTLMEAGR